MSDELKGIPTGLLKIQDQLKKDNWRSYKMKYMSIMSILGITEEWLQGREVTSSSAEEVKGPTTRSSSSSSSSAQNQGQAQAPNPKHIALAYSILVTSISDELCYLIENYALNDLRGCWEAVCTYFKAESRQAQRHRKASFFRRTMGRSEPFTKFVNELRRLQNDINTSATRQDEKISEQELVDTLIEGIMVEHRSIFDPIVTVYDQQGDENRLTFDQMVKKLKPVALRAGLDGSQSSEEMYPAADQPRRETWTYGKIPNAHSIPCRNIIKTGKCSYGNKCKFSHDVPRKDREREPKNPYSSSRGRRLKRVKCFKCNREGHYARNCRSRRNQDSSSDDTSEELSNLVKRMHELCGNPTDKQQANHAQEQDKEEGGTEEDKWHEWSFNVEENEENQLDYDESKDQRSSIKDINSRDSRISRNSRFSEFQNLQNVLKENFLKTSSHTGNLTRVLQGTLGRPDSTMDTIQEESFSNYLLLFQDEDTTSEESNYTDETSATTTSRWIIDSGATIHVTNNRDLFSPNTIKYDEIDIKVANGESTKSPCSGTVVLLTKCNGRKSTLQLEAVRFVEKAPHNLISISRLDRQGFATVTQNGKTAILDKDNKKYPVLIASLNRLYTVQCQNEVLYISNGKRANLMDLYHQRFGHMAESAIRRIMPNIPRSHKLSDCDTCAIMKATKKDSNRSAPPRNVANRPGEYISTDTCEMPIVSQNGYKYFIVVICLYSRYTYVSLLKTKSDVSTKFEALMRHLWNLFGRYPAFLRADQGTEYKNRSMEDICERFGIEISFSTTQNPNQNAHAERKIQTIVMMCRTMLKHAQVHPRFWEYAVQYSVYIQNRIPHRSLRGRTPISFWRTARIKANQPLSDVDTRLVKVFGCTAYAHIPNNRRDSKLSERATPGVFLGMDSQIRGYLIYVTDTKKTIVSKDVTFHENQFPMRKQNVPMLEPPAMPQERRVIPVREAYPRLPPPEQKGDGHIEVKMDHVQDQVEPQLRRSQRGWKPSNQQLRNIAQESNWIDAIDEEFIGLTIEDPRTRYQAMKSEQSEEWKRAEEEELQAMERNQTWTEVKIPENVKPIPCKWVYKVKMTENNDIERFKARLVARGDYQVQGVDFTETFAAVARMKTFRTLLVYAIKRDWKVYQIDVNNAYLESTLEEKVYMKHPPGYEGPEGTCLLLKKSIYGLKQAGRNWYQLLKSGLQQLGFRALKSDTCVYIHSSNLLIVTTYVDDLLFYVGDMDIYIIVAKKLDEVFSIKDPARLHHYTGIGIKVLPEGGMHLTQEAYIERVLKRFRMEDCKISKTPMAPGIKFKENEGEAADVPYLSLLGSLLYAALGTHPEISFAVSTLARFSKNPSQEHWTALKRVLRYLKGVKHLGLKYQPKLTDTPKVNIKIWTDASWIQDIGTGRSQSGVICQIDGCTVWWLSRLQRLIMLSSCHAEYFAMCEGVKEAMWLRQFFSELNIDHNKPIPLLIDNQAAIQLSKKPVDYKSSKYLDIKMKFVCEAIENGVVKTYYVTSTENIADILTKPVDTTIFKKHSTILIA